MQVIARAVDEDKWVESWFSDYSVVTDFERDVNGLETIINEESKKERLNFAGWSAQCESLASSKIWKLNLGSEGWPEGLEAPAKASNDEFGGAGAIEQFMGSGSAREQAEALRAVLRSLFGCWDHGIVIEPSRSVETAWLSSSSERIVKARAVANRWAGALRCAATLTQGPVVALTKPIGSSVLKHDWCMRGSWSRPGEPVVELISKKVTRECSVDTVLQALASALGIVISFELKSHAMIAARYSWYAERESEHLWGDRKTQCEWRNIYCNQTFHADWFSLVGRLRAGIDGEPQSGLRRGDPLWGPRIEPIHSCSIEANWRRPMLAVDFLVDQDDASEKQFHSLDPVAAEWRLTLRFFTAGEEPQRIDLSSESTFQNKSSSSDDESGSREDDFTEDAEATHPLASSLRSAFAFLALASFCATPGALLDRDFVDQAMEADVDLIPSWLKERAQTLATRRGTLSEIRLQAYLADLGRPTAPPLDQSDECCAAAERFSILALRLAGLSSLEATVALWRAFVAMLRTEFEDAQLVEHDEFQADDDDLMQAINQDDDPSNENLSLFLIGSRRLTSSAAAAFDDAGRGCPLRRTVRLSEACAEAISCDEVDDEGIFGLRQIAAPDAGTEALELKRLHAMDPDEAVERKERASLKHLASEMAAFKSDLELEGHDDPEDAFDEFLEKKQASMTSAYDDLTWRQVWEAVIPTPAMQALPFFNAADEAEHALHRLEVAHPVWVLAQLAAAALNTAPLVLRTAHPVSSRIPSVRGAIDTAEAACRRAVQSILSNLSHHDVGPTNLPNQVFKVAATAIDAVAAAETHLARAVALTSRLPAHLLGWDRADYNDDNVTSLLEALLRSAAGSEPLDLNTDSLPFAKALFSSFLSDSTGSTSHYEDEASWNSSNHVLSATNELPIPDQREFVLWAQTAPEPGRWDRDDETRCHRVYAAGYGDAPDTTYLTLALSLADDDNDLF